MKTKTPILSRVMAILLALVLSFANVPGLVLTAFAADENSVSAGSAVAENYELTDAEKALLSSGYLSGGTVTYDAAPGDGQVTLDTENKKILAPATADWVAVSADVVLTDNTVYETVDIVDGVGVYTYDGNAFSVKVTYKAYAEVAADKQTYLLNTIGWLKKGVENLDAGFSAEDDLGVVVMAIDTLVMLADGYSMSLGSATITAQFEPAAAAAIRAFDAQIDKNGDKLDLQVKNAEYYASEAKTSYLLASGTGYKAVLIDTYNKLNAIKNDPACNDRILDAYLEGNEPEKFTAWKAFKNIINRLVATLEPAATDSWTAAAEGTALVSDTVDYAALDSLVAAVSSVTEVPADVVNPLCIDEAVVGANAKMYNVDVIVVMNEVLGNVDSAELKTTETDAVRVTLAEGATAEEVKAEAQTVIDEVLAGWEVYAEEHFDVAYTEIPEVLDKDIVLTATYTPKNYTVTYKYTTDAPVSVPYGYKMTLPVHGDATKAYDYTVNGEKYAQGSVVVIEGNTEIGRSAGKSYVSGNIYSIIADNYGNSITKNILKSGALFGDVEVNYRKPDPTDAESLLRIESGKLFATDYDSNLYNGVDGNLFWQPDTYGANGNENSFPADYDENNGIDWAEKAAKVQYVLVFGNVSNGDGTYTDGAVKAAEVLELAKVLKEEADGQKETLDKLASYHDQMEQLNSAKFSAMSGIVDDTDFTPDDGDLNDAKTLELRKYFNDCIDGIRANNIDRSNNQLTIYNMLTEYKKDGLTYYYNNCDAIINEINTLSGYLSDMTADEEKREALATIMTAAGYPEYVEKIENVEGAMAEVKENIVAPNSSINLGSENLSKLIAALTAEGAATGEADGAPYVKSETITVTDNSQAIIQVIIETPLGDKTVTTEPVSFGTVIEQSTIDALVAGVASEVAALLGENAEYYILTESDSIDALVGTTINSNINIYHTYTEKEYIVKIDGEADQTVTISNMVIKLPKHSKVNWEYRYTIGSRTDITNSEYTFTTEELNTLFTDGICTVDRVAVDTEKEKLEENFGEWIVKNGAGEVIGIHANVDGNKDGIMSFVTTFVDSGYTYIALNDEELLYVAEKEDGTEGALEVKIQTLINAVIADPSFSSEKLIALGNNGEGEFLRANMKLGNSADEIAYDVEFILYLDTVPSQMGKVADGLEEISPYLTFESSAAKMSRARSVDTYLDIDVTLPEKVYEVYLAALLATGYTDKDDIQSIDSEIALMFFWDYIDILINTDATTATYTNTLRRLGVDRDLTGAEDYYQLAKDALLSGVEVNSVEDDGEFDVIASAKGKDAIDKLVELLGIDISEYDTYLGMVFEYKYNEEVTGPIRVNLINTNTDFEAAIVDIRASENTNKFDFTNDLNKRAKEIAGEAAIILLDDIGGPAPDDKVTLTFNSETIIDLNGHTIYGNIVANGKTLIFDSTLNTYNCGGVTGGVSGNATIVGGEYGNDVSALLPEGYFLDGKTVRNVLYTVSENGGKIDFSVDADAIKAEIGDYTEFATVVAADIAVDLVLNYFTAASLAIEGENGVEYSIYNITVEDLIAIYESADRQQALIDEVLDFVSLSELNGFINYIIDELLDFAAIEEAIRSDSAILALNAKINPWHVRIAHNTTEDHFEIGVEPNPDLETTFTIGVKMMSENTSEREYAADLIGGISDIVEYVNADVEINKPSYSNNTFSVSGNGSAALTIDVTKDNNEANNKYGIHFSNEEYLSVFAIVVANGISDTAKKDALVSAVAPTDEMDFNAMKAAIDVLTVEELFTALKNMSVKKDFAAMCNAVGVDASDLGNAEELEKIYHLLANAAGEALEYLDITGPDGRLGSIYEDGYYQISGTRTFEKSASAGGYTLNVGVDRVSAELKIKLYPEAQPHKCTPADPVIENRVEPTCEEEGSYDEVVYCATCGRELSRETKSIDKLPHTPADPVIENRVEPTCEEEGSYDEVVYCEVCGEELSRETKSIDKLPHTPADPVIENKVDATCKEEGSYDEVVYCEVCGEELSRETKSIDKLPHTPAPAVVENRVEPDCENEGSYDEVVYCAVCDEELSRVTRTIPALGHDWDNDNVEYTLSNVNGEWIGTATRYCKRDASHTEIALSTGYEITDEKPATCCEEGTANITVFFDVDDWDWTGESRTFINVIVSDIDPDNHSYTEEITKEPTCEEPGEKTFTCECGDSYTEEIPATGHCYRWVTVLEPTETRKGKMELRCMNCGHVLAVRAIPALGDNERPEEDREDEKNPSTGAFVPSVSAAAAIAVIAGTAFIAKKSKKH